MIVEGSLTGQSSRSKKTYLKVVQNVQLLGQSPKTRTLDQQAITFTDKDASKIHHPHDDAIVITLLIADYSTRRVLVDNGSSADILYYPAFQQMNLGRDYKDEKLKAKAEESSRPLFGEIRMIVGGNLTAQSSK